MQYAGIPIEIWSMILSNCTPKSYTNLMRCIPGLNSYNKVIPIYPKRKLFIKFKDFGINCFSTLISKYKMKQLLHKPVSNIYVWHNAYVKTYESISMQISEVYIVHDCCRSWRTDRKLNRAHVYATKEEALEAAKNTKNYRIIKCLCYGVRSLCEVVYYGSVQDQSRGPKIEDVD
jgi:hypothetical protein